jgi:hypothetical protein
MPAVFITVCYTWRYLYHEHIFIPFYSKSGFNKNTTLSTKRQVLFNLDIFLFTMLHVCYFFIDHTLKKNLLYWLLKIPDFWRQEQMSLCSQGAWPAQLQFLQLIKRELCHIATWVTGSKAMHLKACIYNKSNEAIFQLGSESMHISSKNSQLVHRIVEKSSTRYVHLNISDEHSF